MICDLWHAAAALAAVLLACYSSPFLHGQWEFLHSWDDAINFIDNTMLHEGFSWSSVVKMFTTVKINVYEPLSWMTKAVMYSLYGLDSQAVRLLTLGMHVCVCLLAYAVSCRLLKLCGCDEPLGCLLGTILYAFHPLHVEVVAWPSAQPYALSMIFALMCMYCHIRSLQGNGSTGNSFAAIAFYGCSMLCKSISLFLPIGIFAIDFIIPNKTIWSNLRRYCMLRIPFLLTSCVFGVSMVLANKERAHEEADLVALSISQRAMKAVVIAVWPLRMALWPVELRFHYQFPMHLTWLDSLPMMSVAGIVFITIGCISRGRHTIAAWVYYVSMLLPVSGVIQHGLVFLAADRYAYFPLIVEVPLLAALFHKIQANSTRKLVTMLLCVWSCCLCRMSVLQIGSWRNEETLFRYAQRRDPTDWRILDRLADTLLRSNRLEEAAIYMQQELIYMPVVGLKASLQRAKVLMLLKETSAACAIYEQLLTEFPNHAHVNNNVGICLWKQGRLLAARERFVVATNGSGLTRGDPSPNMNIELIDAWDPRTPIEARLMW